MLFELVLDLYSSNTIEPFGEGADLQVRWIKILNG